ncbi:3-methyl-2-oxobutanoate hydroxymethyltransferase [Shewanella frigidimarina]|uniref:3-methyl-2-oxobutanoate hydroxymethyltransferase n=1 Tax=Shewanella frigidimarina (strain NCIMB 400) TaxID=318167 RepID=PANB_SHEFN|nr:MULTISPECIES: 3-methyl-2-oxobutanoate hydroxymethyltransferase [Shewanella]Q07XZ8.1 RecName: Full=3-methyl-2-oxobutanoate hydroxymethyltransferase; AltName: Full=Ketopantoate hydroxymethyltransferase; Short=KPHMT [Shewanella frigidimarina NCIMB 400]ABI73116.1 3-methyl-2-oxobutanoate hydroxymethyltransferase [Shewanella frigidimarina NCIMB 400]MBB1428322.1 3-methyl-2-oxobutanoate hydroxymethyltransferase [Shewanella sp. SG44-2]PKI07415.1 3-methyl-2-oxobutanoate hydroxymethyltransferase [Shewa|tara:strand:+ start:178 stop:972 length:795 start_codon:yes stop_codon:yes gene_type:complete
MSKVTSSTLIKFKQEGKKFTALTAYDASFAGAFDSEGVDVLLVGDSLGMVLQGHNDTLPVTIADIAYHTACVKRGVARALLIADMPFMSYSTPEQTMNNAAILMQAGASMVKLEGGHWLLESVKMLTERGIPVCAHLGLTPQSVNVFGGFKVQGRDADNAQRILDEAKALQAAGAQLLVVECIPAPLAKAITEALTIPVIGIGAGADTDGQILVMHDVLGISSGYIPRFSKNYLKQTGEIRSAIRAYIDEVANGTFPAEEHTFN